MDVSSEQLRALTESERFLTRMTSWALPLDVRVELDRLLDAYAAIARRGATGRPASEVPPAPFAKCTVGAGVVREAGAFPGNLSERLSEWVASGPDVCPPIPFDIDQALSRIKLVYTHTSWHWFAYEKESELGGVHPSAAMEFFDGAEALRQILWRMSNPRWNGDEQVRRVAFLGIDGVLCPQTPRPSNSFETLKRRVDGNAAIKRLVACLSMCGLDVVVHSDWRTRLTRAQLLELLSMEDGGFGGTSGCVCCSSGSFLIGTTLSTLDGASGIRDAVTRMQLGVDDYVVIDTDSDLLANFAGQAISCDAGRGVDGTFVDVLYRRVGVTPLRR